MIRIAIILLVNLVFFCKAITYKYVSDDIPVSFQKKDSNKWRSILNIISGKERSKPQTDHAITLFFHAVTCVLIYTGFGMTDVSFWAALLFAFNPINNQGSVWISGRAYVLSTICILGVLSFPILSPAFLLASTYFNVGFITPVLLIGSSVAWTLLFLPVCWAINFKRFHVHVKAKIEMETVPEDKRIKWQKFILAFKTFGFYLSHALLPFNTSFYHAFLQSMAASKMSSAYSLKCRYLWFGLASAIGIIFYWLTTPWTMTSFGLLWWCVGIVPFLNFFRCSQEIAERYVYFPLAGLMFVLAGILPAGWHGIFIAIYATRLWFYMDAFQDDFYLQEISSLNSPNSWFAWHVRGHQRWMAQSYHEATIMWTMAKNINPKEFKVLFNLAASCILAGHEKEAFEWIKEAEKNIIEGQEEQSKRYIDWFIKEKKIHILL